MVFWLFLCYNTFGGVIMRKYEIMVPLLAIKKLLEEGMTDKAIELINQFLEVEDPDEEL